METGSRRMLAVCEVLVVLGLLGVTVGLTVQNRRLRHRVNALTTVLYEQSTSRSLQPGDFFMGLELRGDDGRPYQLSFLEASANPESPNVIIAVFDPDCGYCANEVPVWNVLARSSRFGSTFLGVSLGDSEETAHFVEANAVTFPIYFGTAALLEQLRLPGVPATIRFSRSGRVEEVRLGETNYEPRPEY